ncbi:bifunctional glutamine-synthetase adenylyltransferase/deadenyltransferase [Actinobacillus equuli]|nr:bifunctional glutamine-synthetase adenylyltransferase/deadenyltransferase [Actinobacillus equuli]
MLYEVDMRLRPSGEAGLLVSTVSAYESYQQNEAWTWESQALVRTRCVYGSPELAQAFEQIRRTTLAMPRTSGQLRREICEMRYKMYQHLSNTDNAHFDLKKIKAVLPTLNLSHNVWFWNMHISIRKWQFGRITFVFLIRRWNAVFCLSLTVKG